MGRKLGLPGDTTSPTARARCRSDGCVAAGETHVHARKGAAGYNARLHNIALQLTTPRACSVSLLALVPLVLAPASHCSHIAHIASARTSLRQYSQYSTNAPLRSSCAPLRAQSLHYAGAAGSQLNAALCIAMQGETRSVTTS